MYHLTIEELTSFARGELDDGEQAKAASHLATCRVCLVAMRAVEVKVSSAVAREVRRLRDETSLGVHLSEISGPQHSGASVDPAANRFVPGTLLADRYRVVSVLGRGGMGEVCRADDLKLGQTVALKFLAPNLTTNPSAIQYFHREVSLARSISHPYVCRVYDIGDVDGELFLTMEYIDGEDVERLLRRIGRFEPTKGIDIARQLCAGLAAAHERDVLHRDLKPSNIMIDGKGRAKITDFGLARLNAQASSTPEVVGSPAYMAPEQIAYGVTSVQSDLYSLGLVIVEILTGQSVHRDKSAVNSKSDRGGNQEVSWPEDLQVGEDTREIIRRCLASDPAERPRSAMEVRAGLTEMNPLSAAIVRGETPLPEVVAAGDGRSTSSPRLAILIIISLVLCTVLFWCSPMGHLGGWIHGDSFPVRPAVLEHNAQELIRAAGYDRSYVHTPTDGYAFVDRSSGFLPNQFFDPQEQQVGPIESTPFVYWYRASPAKLEPRASYPLKVSWDEPSPSQQGSIRLLTDTQGRLIYFQAQPPTTPGDSGKRVDWAEFLTTERTGIPWEQLKAAEAKYTPPVAYDSLAAWEYSAEGRVDPIHIEAAAFAGRPVYCRISLSEGELAMPDVGMLNQQVLIIRILSLIVLLPLALRNWRAQRCDLPAAGWLAAIVFAMHLTVGVLSAHSGPIGVPRLMAFMTSLRYGVFMAASLWLAYIAMEPYVRRFWPETLISWTRLLHGGFRDPRLGQDVAVGLLAGLLIQVGIRVIYAVAAWLDIPLENFYFGSPESLLSLRATCAVLLENIHSALRIGIYVLVFLFLLRLPLSTKGIAVFLFVAFHTILLSLTGGWHAWLINFVFFAVSAVLLQRFGLVSTVAYFFVMNCAQSFPMPSSMSAWYVGWAALPSILILALGLYGCYVALGKPRIRFLI